MRSVSRFPHVFTQISNITECWLKGMKSMILASGGGQMVITRRGVEVCVRNPERFYRAMDWHKTIGQTHTARLAGIRSEIAAGSYETLDKIAIAADRLAAVLTGER